MPTIVIVRERTDPIAATPPVVWAMTRLVAAFEGRGLRVKVVDDPSAATADSPTVVVAGNDDEIAARWLDAIPHRSSARADARRWLIDVAILASLGGFFAGKIRSAVWYELFATTGNVEAIRRAVEAYRGARQAWIEAATTADVYADDLTFGPQRRLRGHWLDRLPAIDADLQDMADRSASARAVTGDEAEVGRFIDAASGAPPDVDVLHDLPDDFVPGAPVDLSVTLRGAQAGDTRVVEVRFRPMNQALAVSARPMQRSEERFVGSIPPEAVNGTFPLAYSFVLQDRPGHAWRHPGIGVTLASQPYFVVRPSHDESLPSLERGIL